MLTSAARTRRGSRSADNEDAYLALPSLGVFAIADGLGGHGDGALASRTALRALRAQLRAPLSGDRIRNAILGAHAQVCGCAPARLPRSMGATIVVAWVSAGTVDCFHLGDSRAYRFRDYLLQRLTSDHSAVPDDLGRQGAVPARQAAVSRALGMRNEPVIERKRWDWRAGDRLLLLTDGISDCLSDLEIGNVLAEYQSLPSAALDTLISLSESAGGCDDKTVLMAFEHPDASVDSKG